MFLSVFGALVIMMSRLKVSFFCYRTEHAAENLQLRELSTVVRLECEQEKIDLVL